MTKKWSWRAEKSAGRWGWTEGQITMDLLSHTKGLHFIFKLREIHLWLVKRGGLWSDSCLRRSACWQDGESILKPGRAAGSCCRCQVRITVWVYAVTVKTWERGCNWRCSGHRFRENWKLPRCTKWRTFCSRTWKTLMKTFDLLHWCKIQIKAPKIHSYFWVLKV